MTGDFTDAASLSEYDSPEDESRRSTAMPLGDVTREAHALR
jgi:hypothetical protein